MPGPVYEDIIAITGHRDFSDIGAVYRGLDQLRAREYVFGGARGLDTEALKYLARTQADRLRTVVVANRVVDQPQVAREAIRRFATRIVELRNTGPDRFMIRNRYMVDYATHLRAFYDGRLRGGTYRTLQYARRLLKPFSITDLKPLDIVKDLYLPFELFRQRLRDAFVHGESIPGSKHMACLYMQNLSPGQVAILKADLRELESMA